MAGFSGLLVPAGPLTTACNPITTTNYHLVTELHMGRKRTPARRPGLFCYPGFGKFNPKHTTPPPVTSGDFCDSLLELYNDSNVAPSSSSVYVYAVRSETLW